MSRIGSPSNYGTSEYARRWHQMNVMRKFDLVLIHDNGLEYDGAGCFPCIAACRKPTYEAGQMISGYLLVRPTKKIVISGVAVTFSGKYLTNWKEGNMDWYSCRVFYSEKSRVIENRHISMECRWYRFDFEYRIPHGLPTSFKEPDGRLLYYASGSVTQPNGPDIETFDTRFQVKGFLDIDNLPPSFHGLVERRCGKTFQLVLPGSHDVEGTNSDQHSWHGQDGEDFQVYATLCLNSQAFTVGQHIIADVTVENCTNGILLCTLKMEQVFSFEASYAKEDRGKRHTPHFHYMRNRKIARKDITTGSVIQVLPCRRSTCSSMLVIPELVPSTSRAITLPNRSPVLLEREHTIHVKYIVKLDIKPQWDEEGFSVPVEIKVGTHDSRTREVATCSTEQQSQEAECSSESSWDLPPSLENAPPSYEEYFSSSI